MQCGVTPSEFAVLVEGFGADLRLQRPPFGEVVVDRRSRWCGGDVAPQAAPPQIIKLTPIGEEVAVDRVGEVARRLRDEPDQFPAVNPSSPPLLVPLPVQPSHNS